LINKSDKDFIYLKNPSILPSAYEKAIEEIKRRRWFRKVLDEKYLKLNEHCLRERKLREIFIKEFGKYLPTDFVP
jgi:hypothetical protein